MSNKEGVEIGFRYSSFNVKKFALTQIAFPENQPITASFSFDAGFSLNDEKRTFLFRLNTEMTINAGGVKEKVVTLVTESVYDIKDLKILRKDERTYLLPDDLMITLFSIHYSTTRGVLIEKTSGTQYSQFILPAIDIRAMLLDTEGKLKFKEEK